MCCTNIAVHDRRQDVFPDRIAELLGKVFGWLPGEVLQPVLYEGLESSLLSWGVLPDWFQVKAIYELNGLGGSAGIAVLIQPHAVRCYEQSGRALQKAHVYLESKLGLLQIWQGDLCVDNKCYPRVSGIGDDDVWLKRHGNRLLSLYQFWLSFHRVAG